MNSNFIYYYNDIQSKMFMKTEITMRQLKHIKNGKVKKERTTSHSFGDNKEKELKEWYKRNNCKKGGKSRHTF